MPPSQPNVDVRLRVDPPTCDLSRQTRFSLVVLLTIHCKQSVTILKNSDDEVDFGLVYLLQSGLIECIDTDSGSRIPIFSHRRKKYGESKDKETKRSPLLSLTNNRADYVTFTTDPKPRAYEFGLDASHLRPGRHYTIHSHPWDIGWWSYSSVEECLEHFDTHGKLPHGQIPALHCSPGNMVSFSCQEGTPKPPQVDVSLIASSTLSLSASPPFQFVITFISHASQPFTALAQRSHDVATHSDIEIVDVTTQKRVAPDLIDDGDVEGLWDREDFLILEPGKPHAEERTLSMKDGLEELQPGSDYILRFPKNSWRWWSYDSLDDVMRLGKRHEATDYFGDEFSIDLVCHDEVKVRVVE